MALQIYEEIYNKIKTEKLTAEQICDLLETKGTRIKKAITPKYIYNIMWKFCREKNLPTPFHKYKSGTKAAELTWKTSEGE
jgi:hypothetical protein